MEFNTLQDVKIIPGRVFVTYNHEPVPRGTAMPPWAVIDLINSLSVISASWEELGERFPGPLRAPFLGFNIAWSNVIIASQKQRVKWSTGLGGGVPEIEEVPDVVEEWGGVSESPYFNKALEIARSIQDSLAAVPDDWKMDHRYASYCISNLQASVLVLSPLRFMIPYHINNDLGAARLTGRSKNFFDHFVSFQSFEKQIKMEDL